MKWIPKEHKHGDTRIIKRFLLFPKWVGNEIRWLEIIKIKQEYWGRQREVPSDGFPGWYSKEFID